MKIVILGLNYAPEPVGIAVYTAGMAEYLAGRGHDVQVIAGNPYFPAWRLSDGFSFWGHRARVENGVNVRRVSHYIPKIPTGARRLLHYASFAVSSALPLLATCLRTRPDLVVTVAPSLLAAGNAAMAASLCGARSWLHVQDFEADAAVATGLIDTQGLVAKLARWVERTSFAAFDVVSSISPQMCRRLVQKGCDPRSVHLCQNWADLTAVQPMTGPSLYREEWGITTPHVALYSGTVANKQGIEIVVDAAHLLQHRTDLTFVICGQGPNRDRLQERCGGLPNVLFHDLQPKQRLSDLLGMATVHLLPQIAGVADLVLPSKLGNMLASGRPVVATADQGTGLYDAVDGCGLVTPPADAAAFAGAIVDLIDDPERAASLGNAARQRALDRWHDEAILSGVERRMLDLVVATNATRGLLPKATT